MHTLHYIRTTCGQGIALMGTEKLTLKAFGHSDWGACVDSRRSVTSYILMLGHSPICWKSKKQSNVSLSSSEVEY